MPVKYYDISVPISADMAVWPSDPPVRIAAFKSMARGDHSNVLKVEFGTHTGSHVDSPNHFGMSRTVDRLSLDAMIGPAQVVAVKSQDAVRPSDLKGLDLAKVKRVLFKTRNSKRIRDKRFHADYVALAPETAALLARRRVRLVGIDAMSIDPKGGPAEAHNRLLGIGAVILENIDLSKVPAGRYELICLPLKLENADGAPARVVLVRR